MAINIKGFQAINCGVGILTHESAPLNIENYVAIDTKTALEIRESLGIQLSSLGLKSDTPKEVLIEALRALKGVQNLPVPAQAEKLRSFKIVEWLAVGANLTTVVTGLLPLLDRVKP